MENQNLEWKRQWRDEFLKGICGFANAQGGTLEIGRDDDGTVIGIDNARELLEELPNTIRQALGIVPSVGLFIEDGKQYIAVSVDASSTPVSFRGKHYLRSGSSTQELNGYELNNFILHRMGKTWDGIVIPDIKIADLDISAFRKFRERSLASERLQKADLEMSDEALLDSLALIENGKLTRAAALLFHGRPEKYVFGAYVKIGYFENDADLIYQDEFHGPLISMPDEIVDTIYRKYFKGVISYEGLQRVEDFPIPRSALREAILNAIVHRDYSTGIPIQIKFFPDCVIVYNDGRLPENWTVADLLKRHRSRPYNPKLAYAFYRSGYIETWGRGIERITTACREAGKPAPVFEASSSEIAVTFSTNIGKELIDEFAGKFVDGFVGEFVEKFADGFVEEFVESEKQQVILKLMLEQPAISAKSIAEYIGMTPRGIQKNIDILKKAGLVERLGAAKGGHWVVKNKKFVEKFVYRFVDEFAEEFVENEKQRAILKLMLEQPAISTKGIAEHIGMTPRGVQKNIDILKKARLVERLGTTRGGHWVVKKQADKK